MFNPLCIFVSGIRKQSTFTLLTSICLIFPTSLIEKTFSPTEYSWLLYDRLVDHINVGLFMGSLFYSTDPCVWFHTSTILFWLLWLCIPHKFDFEIRKQDNSSLYILKLSLAIWGLLWFHTNFRTICSVKNATGILTVIVLNMKITLGYTDILTMLILSIHYHVYLPIYLCSISFIFVL